jgi:hypothetical protein
MSSHFMDWLKNKGLSDGKIEEVVFNLEKFHEYLRGKRLILCEAKDSTIVDWVNYKSSGNKSSYYNQFELLSYPIEYYQEQNVDINFKLTNVYLILKNKRFNNEMFRLHIDNLLTQFRQHQMDYEYDYKFNESNVGVNFIVNNKKIRVLYAEFKEEYNAFQVKNNVNETEYDYLLILCLMNETVKKTLIIPNNSTNKFEDNDLLTFEISDKNIADYDNKWESLKIG